MQPNRPMLEGVKIADMTSVIFGPYCTHMLADMGAEVVKVEPASMDTGRTVGRPLKTPGMGAMHMNVNRGKRSVKWDLKQEAGRERVRALIKSSDVFIHNIRSDAIARMGFDYESVRAFAPGIIYVHLTGFDSEGPDAGQPAYDDIIQAATGVATLLPRVDGRPEPRYIPLAVGDKVAALYGVQGVLAAIIHKLRTGEGQFVEVPMFESVTDFVLVEHLGAAVFPDLPRRAGYGRQIDPDRQPSPTKDGYISLAPYTDERWIRFLTAIGRADILQEEELGTTERRMRNRNLLYVRLATITPEKTTAEWMEIARGLDIPARPVNTLEQLLDDPQLTAVNFFKERVHPTEGRYYEIRPAVKFSARRDADLGFAPHVGEHTAEVDAELGFGAE
jgi:crotonobetainyl-CoA:carnitine CoA-transferase CaiB-like acyl-CoA transferase